MSSVTASTTTTKKRTPLSQSSANIQRQKNSNQKAKETLLDWALNTKIIDSKLTQQQTKETKSVADASIQTSDDIQILLDENELLKMKLFDKEVEVMQLNENNQELKTALKDTLKENEMLHNFIHSSR